MTTWKLIARSLTFHWRTHLGVAAGAAVATAVLVGALVVGDSVRGSLRTLALRRLGGAHLAMASGDRFFRAESLDANEQAADLAAAISGELNTPAAPALLLDGSVKTPDGSARANGVQVVGVDRRFWQVGGAPNPLAGAAADQAVLNAPLAAHLDVGKGDEIILRIPVPSGLPRDAPLAVDTDAVTALRPTVRAVASDADFGRFSLRANQTAPFTVFVPLSTLQKKLGLAGRGNVLLIARPGGRRQPPDVAEAAAALRKHWRLADADLELRELPNNTLELRTGRVFLDAPAGEAALAADPRALAILAYFANEVRRGDANSPYCIVAAMAPTPSSPRDARDEDPSPTPASPVPADLADNEIILNQWLADDLGAKTGDQVRLSFYRPGPMRQFVEATETLRVRKIVPIATPGVDPNLLPDFPGLADKKNCRDWKPGIKIDLDRIRPKDEKYWDDYRGTPKAFVSLSAGRRMWGNRFGDLTAVRYPLTPGARLRVAKSVLGKLDPARIGLYFLPVRDQAMAAAEPISDFGGLFLGLSFFLIVAAVLLTGLLFVFGVEQRSQQTGTLLALGFRPGRVRRLMLLEGGTLALIGSAVGAVGGLAYTFVVLLGLATVWQGVSVSSPIHFHAELTTVLMGAGLGFAVALLAMWFTLLRQGRVAARELLAASPSGRVSAPAGWVKLAAGASVGAICVLAAAGLVLAARDAKGMAAAGTFFAAGGLLLVGGLSLCYVLLAALSRARHIAATSLTGLGVRTSGRRRWRSLTTAGLLACGIFLVASVEVFRLDPLKDAGKATSGTGGFALYGESAVPVLHDLNDEARRQKMALAAEEFEDVRFVQLRVQEGDDASCLNLNRVQRPRLLAVRPELLSGRFTFLQAVEDANTADPWMLLNRDEGPDVVPAIGDEPTITWAIGKGVGQTIDYTDERGRPFRIRLVGMVGSSILQGNLLICEKQFQRRFPSTSGYRAFLLDAPRDRTEDARKAFSRALEDFGLELRPAARRLAEFNEVQNTYLSIFAALGGLGLLLGSVALGVVLLRNVMERRGELALLRAVGFSRGRVQWMVLCEHWGLLALGLMCGVFSAVVAVLPALRPGGAAVPYFSWSATLVGVAGSGLLWTWLATALVLHGRLLPALRTE